MEREINRLEKILKGVENASFRGHERIHPRRENRNRGRREHIEKEQFENPTAFPSPLSMRIIKNQATGHDYRGTDEKADVRCQKTHGTHSGRFRRNDRKIITLFP